MSEVFTKDINRGLQLYLPLNEIVLDADQEKEVVDISGARLNGKVNGAIVVADSKFGHCIYFDGVDDYIEMPEMNVDYSQGLTVAAWVYYNSLKRWSRIIDFANGEDNDNILFANEDEAISLVETDHPKSVQILADLVDEAVITRGPLGAVISHGGQNYLVEAKLQGPVIDTTGAGDLFAAGYLFGRTHGYDAQTSGQIASMLAGEVISHIGARPKADLKALIKPLVS